MEQSPRRTEINVLAGLDEHLFAKRGRGREEKREEAEYKKGNKSPILINVTMDVRFIALLAR